MKPASGLRTGAVACGEMRLPRGGWLVAAFDPPRRLTPRSQAGPVKLTIDHELEPNRGGTRPTVVASGKPGG
jgi:hypothetical protein